MIEKQASLILFEVAVVAACTNDVSRNFNLMYHGIEPPYRLAHGPTQPPVLWVRGVKRPGRGVNYAPPSSSEIKEKLELSLLRSIRYVDHLKNYTFSVLHNTCLF